jgi:hypothetical protein
VLLPLVVVIVTAFPAHAFHLSADACTNARALSAPEKATTDSQRGNYRDGKLDADRQRRLEQLPGQWPVHRRPARAVAEVGK